MLERTASDLRRIAVYWVRAPKSLLPLALLPLNRRTKLEFILPLAKPLAEALKFA